jgi:serine/threonine protein kinase
MKNLFALHREGIVHNDITPDNIMYSLMHNKPIFIDYGFSALIGEEIGFKTYTNFQGTPKYVSKEMLKIFSVEETK